MLAMCPLEVDSVRVSRKDGTEGVRRVLLKGVNGRVFVGLKIHRFQRSLALPNRCLWDETHIYRVALCVTVVHTIQTYTPRAAIIATCAE